MGGGRVRGGGCGEAGVELSGGGVGRMGRGVGRELGGV